MLSLCLFLKLISITVATIPASEQQALIDIYNSTNGNNWVYKQNWLTNSDACTWYGITCNSAKTNVENIELQQNGLTGSLPNSIGNFPELNFLSLDIAPNHIGGTLPASIGNLTKMTLFSIASQNFVGDIPESFGNLKSLVVAHLNDNHFTSIPDSIKNLGPLQSLAINDNGMHNVSLPPSGPSFEPGFVGACKLGGNNEFECPLPEWVKADKCGCHCL